MKKTSQPSQHSKKTSVYAVLGVWKTSQKTSQNYHTPKKRHSVSCEEILEKSTCYTLFEFAIFMCNTSAPFCVCKLVEIFTPLGSCYIDRCTVGAFIMLSFLLAAVHYVSTLKQMSTRMDTLPIIKIGYISNRYL